MNAISSNISNTHSFLSGHDNTARSNGFKSNDNISLDAAVDLNQTSGADSLRNPYSIDQVSDEAWNTFVKATQGYSELEVESSQKLLFENSEFSNSMTDAISLLDWAKRADVIKENIALPQSNSSQIPESKKQMLAAQMKSLVDAQTQIFDNFSYLAQNGGSLSIDLVA